MMKLKLLPGIGKPAGIRNLPQIKLAKCLFIVIVCLFSITNTYAQVGISSSSITPDASSILELRSSAAGFLPPRMTTVLRNAIASPATGLLVFNTDTNQLNYFDGTSWQILSGGTAVTSVSVTTANGVSGTVANPTSTPAISLTLGAITPSSVAATGTVTGSNLSGTNTGDQTLASLGGQAQLNGTGFVKASGTTISYDNSTYLTGNQSITLSGDVTGSGTTAITTNVGKINGTSLASLGTGILKNTTGTGVPSIAIAGDFPTLNQNTTGSAATLTTGRTISITGDLAYTSPAFNGSSNVTAAGTLATVNGNVGSFTNANITVNAKGLITAASNGTVKARYQATPADPATTTSTVGKMMDLGGSVTPAVSGTIMITISGDMDNSSNNDGGQVQIRYGTGSAPANGAALTGTTAGSLIKMGQSNSANRMPFHCNTIVSGLAVGTAYWIDLDLASNLGGTVRIRDISISIIEL